LPISLDPLPSTMLLSRLSATSVSGKIRPSLATGTHPGEDKFALKLRPENRAAPGEGFHLAFAAPSREAVLRFHEAALAHGGRDNGGAGLHPEYGPDYFAAFVIDPDGYRIEAVITGDSSASVSK